MGVYVSTSSMAGFGLVPLNVQTVAARNQPRQADAPGPRPAAANQPAPNATVARMAGRMGVGARLSLPSMGTPRVASLLPPGVSYPNTPEGLIARFNNFATFVRSEQEKSAQFMRAYSPAVGQAVAALVAYNRNPREVSVSAISNLRNALANLATVVRPLPFAAPFVSGIGPILGALDDAITTLRADRPVPRRIVDDLVDISSVSSGIGELNATITANQAQPIANAIRQFCSTLPA